MHIIPCSPAPSSPMLASVLEVDFLGVSAGMLNRSFPQRGASTASGIFTYPAFAVWHLCHSQSCCNGDGEQSLEMERSEPHQKSILNGSMLKLGKTLQQRIWGAEEEKRNR